MRRLALLLLTFLAAPLAAQQATTAGTGTVSGTVRDSLGGGVLAGASVQLVGGAGAARVSRTATADSAGRYTVSDLPAGRYVVGFLHPALDSLGLEPPTRDVVVQDARTVVVDLATPSPARMRAAICTPAGTAPSLRPATDSSAVLVGVVRQASDGLALENASVVGEWDEVTFGASGIGRRSRRLVATTGADGWFALCNVPRGGTMSLQAVRRADSTALLELQVPASGFLHQPLYLGPARTIAMEFPAAAAAAAAATAPSSAAARAARDPAPRVRRVLVGDGVVSGTVLAANGRRPLEGAVVRLQNGPEARTNAQGEWTLTGAPAGTRFLEVRALGFYPDRRPVNVVPNAPPVRVTLTTFKDVLDTVRVSAARYDRGNLAEFEARRRTGVGRYYSGLDVAKRNATVVSDVLRTVPGLTLQYSGTSPDQLLRMRDAAGEGCRPMVYVDGVWLRDATVNEIDTAVQPKDIKALEVYPETGLPAQFRQPLEGCGAIVIWTR